MKRTVIKKTYAAAEISSIFSERKAREKKTLLFLLYNVSEGT